GAQRNRRAPSLFRWRASAGKLTGISTRPARRARSAIAGERDKRDLSPSRGEGARRRGRDCPLRRASPTSHERRTAMSSPNHSRPDNPAADQRMADGIQKNEAKLPPSFPLEGQTMTPAAVALVLQGRIETGKAVLAAESARAAAVKADRDKRAQTRSTALAF